MMFPRRCFMLCAIVAGTQILGCSTDSKNCSDRPQIHAGSVEITGLDGSAKLEDLECVQVVTGDLTISAGGLTSLESLGSLVQVLGDVTIKQSDLPSLQGLEHLSEIGGELSLTKLSKLQSLKGLEGVTRLHGLELDRLPLLETLDGLSAGLQVIDGNLSLESLPALLTLEGLGELRRIGGDLVIGETSSLTSLEGLRSLVSIGGSFQLFYNSALASVGVRSPSVGGEIMIYQNESLTVLDGFGAPSTQRPQCNTESRDKGISVSFNNSLERLVLPEVRNTGITVSNNDRLVEVTAPEYGGNRACVLEFSNLPSLTTVKLIGWNTDSLNIWNTGLTTLDGFSTSVNCSLTIDSNSALTNISALSPAGRIASEVRISNNPSLATCQVQSLVNAMPATTSQCLLEGRMTEGARLVTISGNDNSVLCE